MTYQSHSFLTDEDRAAIANIGHRATVRRIVRDVCAQVNIRPEVITGPSRRADDVQVRDLVCYIAHRNGLSYAAIGRALNRDHTTIIDAVRREAGRRGEA